MNGNDLRYITAMLLNHIAHLKRQKHEGLEVTQRILQGGEGMLTLTFSGVV